MSVDIPSGWTVDSGENSQGFEQPECLVSLSAPKLAAAQFKGVHYLGGRFMPAALVEKYGCKCPIPYKDADQFVKLSDGEQNKTKVIAKDGPLPNMRASFQGICE